MIALPHESLASLVASLMKRTSNIRRQSFIISGNSVSAFSRQPRNKASRNQLAHLHLSHSCFTRTSALPFLQFLSIQARCRCTKLAGELLPFQRLATHIYPVYIKVRRPLIHYEDAWRQLGWVPMCSCGQILKAQRLDMSIKNGCVCSPVVSCVSRVVLSA